MSNFWVIAFVISVLLALVIGLAWRVWELESGKKELLDSMEHADEIVRVATEEVEMARGMVARARGISRLNALARTRQTKPRLVPPQRQTSSRATAVETDQFD